MCEQFPPVPPAFGVGCPYAMRVLVLNCGSSSIKFQQVNIDDAGNAPARAHRRPRGSVEHIGGRTTSLFVDQDGGEFRDVPALPGHAEALQYVFDQLTRDTFRSPSVIDAVGHRVVHGGNRFTSATVIDASSMEEIERLNDLAPLHNPNSVRGIRAARAAYGPDLPMVAVFDTAFHHAMPAHATTYAIPAALARRYGIRRYGFHGIAHQYVATRYGEISGTPLERARIVTVHLGSGCSVTAIDQGRSIDTSMGFTPLEGLVMSTRSGDLDPSLVGYLARREDVAPDTVERWLNERSGLLGLSERSADMHELTEVMESDAAARLAVEVFCYRVSKYIGAYLTVLGGGDAVIFSGGIGEHSPIVRARICERLRWCDLLLDAQRNADAVGQEERISSGGRLQAYVIPADEELLIARETVRCLRATS